MFLLINPLSIKNSPNWSEFYLPSVKKNWRGCRNGLLRVHRSSLSRDNSFWRIYFLSTFGRWAINSQFFVARSLKTAFYVSIVMLWGKIVLKKIHLFSWFVGIWHWMDFIRLCFNFFATLLSKLLSKFTLEVSEENFFWRNTFFHYFMIIEHKICRILLKNVRQVQKKQSTCPEEQVGAEKNRSSVENFSPGLSKLHSTFQWGNSYDKISLW